MKSSLQSLWRANLFFYLGLCLHCGYARILTEVQIGPLYRVVGAPLSISCNVTGFANAGAIKIFEYLVQKPGSQREENVISTSDPDFAYAKYKRRAEKHEIALTHTSPNTALFEIYQLEKTDEGEYECSSVKNSIVYDGIYSAKTSVKVIDNSLSVSSSASTSLSYNEGDAFTSTCQASSNTIQHTHLSFAWFLHKDGEENPQPIISLDRYFTLSPGPGFEGRYRDGLIRLDKIGKSTYRLNIAQLKLSDQGRVFCRAQEWIQDPDRSWYAIAQKDTEGTVLQVNPTEVVPDVSSLLVRISSQSTALQVGQKLTISCNVNAQSSEERFFSVAWFRGDDELARIGPTGILTVGHEYSVREEELKVARIGDRDFYLRLQPVRIEDQGEYICRAWPQKRGQHGDFTQGAAQDSTPQRISISATESGLSLDMQGDMNVTEGDRLTLTCRVHGYKGQLSITWRQGSTTVISLDQEGVVVEELKSRKIKATRPAADTFTLELDDATPESEGVYQCAVSEWENNRVTNSRSQTSTVTVVPAASFIKVNLKSRDNMVTIGENALLICQVRGVHVPITVTWSLLRDDSSIENILTVNSNGGISWSASQHRYQLNVQRIDNGFIHSLLIRGASNIEAGRYQCTVSHNTHMTPAVSNQLAVQVNEPVSNLVLTSTRRLKTTIDTDVEIKCFITSEPSVLSRYAVTWYLKQNAEKKILLSSDRDAKVTFGLDVNQSQRQRISMKRTKGPSFELNIRQAWISDNGIYSCEVAEWQQDPKGDWYRLSSVSEITNLTVTEPEKKLSVLQEDTELNVTSSEDFTIHCHITSRASNDSQFQVTWYFWQNETESKQRPIFTAYRNSTLQDWFKKGDQLRFGHFSPNQFSLTVSRPGVEYSGLYVCEVEEWLLSPSHGWRKSAVEKSGVLTVYVYAEGYVKETSECNSGTWIGILVAFIICTLVVIFLLVLKICRSNASGGKKSGQSLWAEQPLNPKSSADDSTF